MSPVVSPFTYRLMTASQKQARRPESLGTTASSNAPCRSRGTSMRTWPMSVRTVFGVDPFRAFAAGRGSPGSYPRCSVNSAARAVSKTFLVNPLRGAGRDLQRRGQGPRHRRRGGVRRRLRRQVPKAVAKVVNDLDVLLAFYDFPAEHWTHLRTTNPIESTFATVRLRQRVTKGPCSRAAGMTMAFKLIESAQARWRAVNAPHLVALVRAGAEFKNGKLVERPDESADEIEGGQQVA